MLSSALYLDLRYQRIPNKLCLYAFVLALLLQSINGQWQGLAQALLGAGLAFALLLPAYVFRWLAAGDVKLMIAVGALSGPQLLLWSVLYGIIFGTFTSFALALYKVGWSGMKKMMKKHFVHAGVNGGVKAGVDGADIHGVAVPVLQVPYAPALALGWLMACYLDPSIMLLVNNFGASYFY
ncbi:prepilin peptidase [Colwellia sp. BRX10-3]|uniref:A24 family peptidase n=1 Tax=Colwellia sp. BRX10-3 TaxID=2759844 RepID=UPI0015F68C68|nr:A24 family peptidase [Colwellia sp. BRX10-3]MBA6390715.1 prepilin peptidase [Colwellia sp. BRX10-3]